MQRLVDRTGCRHDQPPPTDSQIRMGGTRTLIVVGDLVAALCTQLSVPVYRPHPHSPGFVCKRAGGGQKKGFLGLSINN